MAGKVKVYKTIAVIAEKNKISLFGNNLKRQFLIFSSLQPGHLARKTNKGCGGLRRAALEACLPLSKIRKRASRKFTQVLHRISVVLGAVAN